MNKIKKRRESGATCTKCKSPDWKYNGLSDPGLKHQFVCNSCGNEWQYGKSLSTYTDLI